MKFLFYLFGILVLIYIQYKCFQTNKQNIRENIKLEAQHVHIKKQLENNVHEIKKTNKTLGIFIAYDYDIKFSDLSNADCLRYIRQSFHNVLNFTETYYFINEPSVKDKYEAILKSFYDKKIDGDEMTVFIWICSVSTFAYTANKKYEKVIKLHNDYLYENDVTQYFIKYPKTKFVCGFHSNNDFLPPLHIQFYETKSEIKPEKTEYNETLRDYSLIKPFSLNYDEKIYEKVQLQFYEMSNVLQKTMDWEAVEGEQTNQFVWCFCGPNLTKTFILYLEILGLDTSLESFCAYLNEHEIKQKYGKLFTKELTFKNLF